MAGARGVLEDPQQPIRPHPPIRRFYKSESDRRGLVGQLFDDASDQYEWINRLMSLGSGQRYRRDALRSLPVWAARSLAGPFARKPG